MLLPEAMQDWLPEGHLAYFISDTVDTLDLSAFHARYDKDGPRNQPFHPAMMVKVLVYGYATGVFSSRKIDRKLHEDVAFRVLAAGNFPAHRTIRDFRALHLKELSELFVQVVRLAREMGLGQAGHDRGRRHQAQGQRQPPQGDELRAHAQGRGRAEGTDRRAAAARQAGRRGREERARAGHPGRDRAARGAAGGHRRGPPAPGATPARRRHSSAGAATTTTEAPWRTASPRVAATSASSACPRPRRRTTSPTPTAAS